MRINQGVRRLFVYLQLSWIVGLPYPYEVLEWFVEHSQIPLIIKEIVLLLLDIIVPPLNGLVELFYSTVNPLKVHGYRRRCL
jgi:hypothetical protein